MRRVVISLIVIALWLPLVILLCTSNSNMGAVLLSGLYTVLITCLVCIPLVGVYIKFKLVKFWQFILSGAAIGAGWAFALSASKIELNIVIGTVIICSLHAVMLWILAFWKNTSFIK